MKVRTALEVLAKYELDIDDVKMAMIEFAQEHAKAQVEAIINNVSLTDFASEFLQEGASEAIDKDSILTAYPLTNIV